jgi:crotonobetainyl-CoA:carnitine CoA-transferase CaiB-like acyl-CoA transferase
VPEILAHPQVAGRRLAQRFENVPGADREVAVTTAGFTLSGVRPVADTPPPRLGEHTEGLLRDLGHTDDEIARLRAGGVI